MFHTPTTLPIRLANVETQSDTRKAMTICKNLLISSGFLIIDQKHLNQHNITLPDRNQLLLN